MRHGEEVVAQQQSNADGFDWSNDSLFDFGGTQVADDDDGEATMPGAQDADAGIFDFGFAGIAEPDTNNTPAEHEDPSTAGAQDPDADLFDFDVPDSAEPNTTNNPTEPTNPSPAGAEDANKGGSDWTPEQINEWVWQQSEFQPAARAPAEIQAKMTVSAVLNRAADEMEVD